MPRIGQPYLPGLEPALDPLGVRLWREMLRQAEEWRRFFADTEKRNERLARADARRAKRESDDVLL